jgi:hypothetical protein
MCCKKHTNGTCAAAQGLFSHSDEKSSHELFVFATLVMGHSAARNSPCPYICARLAPLRKQKMMLFSLFCQKSSSELLPD